MKIDINTLKVGDLLLEALSDYRGKDIWSEIIKIDNNRIYFRIKNTAWEFSRPLDQEVINNVYKKIKRKIVDFCEIP